MNWFFKPNTPQRFNLLFILKKWFAVTTTQEVFLQLYISSILRVGPRIEEPLPRSSRPRSHLKYTNSCVFILGDRSGANHLFYTNCANFLSKPFDPHRMDHGAWSHLHWQFCKTGATGPSSFSSRSCSVRRYHPCSMSLCRRRQSVLHRSTTSANQPCVVHLRPALHHNLQEPSHVQWKSQEPNCCLTLCFSVCIFLTLCFTICRTRFYLAIIQSNMFDLRHFSG